MLKFALLGFLNYGPYSGYDLKQLIDVSIQHFWHAKQSQVYTTLKRLEEEGLVSSSIQAQESRPDRRVYAITETGRTAFEEWTHTPNTELNPNKDALLLKLFFSGSVDKETLLSQLVLQQKLHIDQLRHYQTETREVIASSSSAIGLKRDAQMWEATRQFGESFEKLYVRWLEDLQKLVEDEF